MPMIRTWAGERPASAWAVTRTLPDGTHEPISNLYSTRAEAERELHGHLRAHVEYGTTPDETEAVRRVTLGGR
jgi:hypothetical protein